MTQKMKKIMPRSMTVFNISKLNGIYWEWIAKLFYIWGNSKGILYSKFQKLELSLHNARVTNWLIWMTIYNCKIFFWARQTTRNFAIMTLPILIVGVKIFSTFSRSIIFRQLFSSLHQDLSGQWFQNAWEIESLFKIYQIKTEIILLLKR